MFVRKIENAVQGNADSGIQEIFSSGIRDPGNFARGIQNCAWALEYPEYRTRNPEFHEL